ncbi:hypothetical protein [Brucella pituitosa]|uniref:hypothetical protein n=1 Tax=Brucella pituitosa TaxID=571256 RepID=UPI003F4A899C
MKSVDPRIVEIALENATGSTFESFFNAFYAAIGGVDFIPQGGMHDGGADAFQDDTIFGHSTGRIGHFYQATVQADHRAKIRQTVTRLRAFGREPKVLTFFTSHIVPVTDRAEETLGEELDVVLKIRDRKYITAHINHSDATRAAFKAYLEPGISFLKTLGGATTIDASPNIPARTMCVFLGQEIDRRRGNTDLLESVTDSLLLWALEGTDPDQGQFLTQTEIIEKIESALPSAKKFIRGTIEHRLAILSQKGNSSGREIRSYKGEKYCLPYETRLLVQKENTDDEYLKLSVTDTYHKRALEILEEDESVTADQIAKISHRALEITFEREGLELATTFSTDSDNRQYPVIADHIDVALNEANITGAKAITAKSVALGVLRQAFYNSTENERIYYGKLSRTYTLMFTLRNEPKIVEYFKGMSGNFVLFIGSDIIVRALSEKYLPEADQMTVNMLKVLRSAGSTLLLTRMAVDEVHAHILTSDKEFKHLFMGLEPYLTPEIARESKRILIRAYFYAKFNKSLNNKPNGWKSYVKQFCDYDTLNKTEQSREQIKHFLIEKFGFDYLDDEDLKSLTNDDEVRELAEKFRSFKTDDALALNDAQLVYSVYGKRRELKESHKPNPYGYRCWWLTHESRIKQATGRIVHRMGARYIIRPEFILNFVALSPRLEEVRKSYNTVFPTLLGVRLANRMREDIFHDVMDKAKEYLHIDDARVKVMLATMSNSLKGDNNKHYDVGLSSNPLDL